MGVCGSTKDKNKKDNKEKSIPKESTQKETENKNENQKQLSSGGYTSREERTEKKPDGTIVKTIIEKKEGETKKTTITKKGNSTETKTEIERTQVTKTTKKTTKNTTNTNNNINSNFKGDIPMNDFQKESLEIHNKFRKKHHSPPLKLNLEICKIAENYAKELAKKNSFQHSKNQYKGSQLGENLFMCQGYPINGNDMSQSWYNEIKDFNFNKNDFKSGTGHFTQLIWKNSTDVGFGYCKNNKGIYFGVANYFPAGNYMGQFKENVLPA